MAHAAAVSTVTVAALCMKKAGKEASLCARTRIRMSLLLVHEQGSYFVFAFNMFLSKLFWGHAVSF